MATSKPATGAAGRREATTIIALSPGRAQHDGAVFLAPWDVWGHDLDHAYDLRPPEPLRIRIGSTRTLSCPKNVTYLKFDWVVRNVRHGVLGLV